MAAEHISNQSFSSISADGATDLPGGGNTQPPDGKVVRKDEKRRKLAMDFGPVIVDALELGAPANALVWPEHVRGHEGRSRRAGYSLLTVSRFRPFARRRLRTRRPFFELMRTRNPCAFLRRRLFGWNVRFPFIVCSRRGYSVETNSQC